MQTAFAAWNKTVESSIAGKDYPEGKLTTSDRETVRWTSMSAYKPYVSTWRQRPEYQEFVDYVSSQLPRRIMRWTLRFAVIFGIFLVVWFWRRESSV